MHKLQIREFSKSLKAIYNNYKISALNLKTDKFNPKVTMNLK